MFGRDFKTKLFPEGKQLIGIAVIPFHKRKSPLISVSNDIEPVY